MARQTIRAGGMIDVATADEVADIVARTFARYNDKRFHQEKGAVILSAGGTGQKNLALPRMFGWLMQRVTISTTAACQVEFFQDDVNGSDLREVIPVPASGQYSDSFDNVLYMPPGSTLIIIITGGPASGSVSYNLQCQLIESAEG
jgi:hypothetical protein